MASEMIERVARAICESEKMNPDDALGGWIHWTDAARAAIEAMREPTVEMLLAGNDAQETDPFGARYDNRTEAARGKIGPRWRAMIDTALAAPLPVHNHMTDDALSSRPTDDGEVG